MLSQLLKTQAAVRSTRETMEENRKKAEDALGQRELYAKKVAPKIMSLKRYLSKKSNRNANL